MAKSDSDLAKAVLQELSVIDAVSEPSGEDDAFVKARSLTTHERLRKKQIVYWSPTSIPDEVFDSLVVFMAGVVSGAYGDRVGDAEMMLREELLATDAKPRYLGTLLQSDFPSRNGALFNFTTGE